MQERGTFHGSDVLHFPPNLVFKPCAEGWIIVSPETANWIVIKSEKQRCFLGGLIEGKTIGEVYQSAERECSLAELKKLLAAIKARNFANNLECPQANVIQNFNTLNIYITNACNLRCQHCFVNAGIPLRNELSLDEWEKVLETFRAAGGKAVTITGGEPAIRHDLPIIVKKAANIGLNVTILTNGILWNELLIKSIAPFVSEVQISLDGVDEEMNAKVRGEGYFKKIEEAIIAFANAGVHTSVSTTFTLETISADTAQRYQSLISSINNQCHNPVFFKLSTKILPGRKIRYSAEQNEQFLREINKIQQIANTINTYDFFMENHSPNTIIKNCGYGGLSIKANGDVFFCNRILELESYGNVRDFSLKHFIQLGKEAYEKTDVNHLHPCKSCYLKYICGGGCRIDDCNFKGKLTNIKEELKNVQCSQEKKQRLLQKMIESFLYKYSFE